MKDITLTLTQDEVTGLLMALGEFQIKSGLGPLAGKIKEQLDAQAEVVPPKE
jgi:hypothetical protein